MNDPSIEIALPAIEEMQLNVPLKIPGLISSDTYLNIDNKEKKTNKKKKKKKKRKGKKGIRKKNENTIVQTSWILRSINIIYTL